MWVSPAGVCVLSPRAPHPLQSGGLARGPIFPRGQAPWGPRGSSLRGHPGCPGPALDPGLSLCSHFSSCPPRTFLVCSPGRRRGQGAPLPTCRAWLLSGASEALPFLPALIGPGRGAGAGPAPPRPFAFPPDGIISLRPVRPGSPASQRQPLSSFQRRQGQLQGHRTDLSSTLPLLMLILLPPLPPPSSSSSSSQHCLDQGCPTFWRLCTTLEEGELSWVIH